MIMFAVTAFADSVLDKMIGVWNEVNYHDGELTISKEGDDYFVEYIDFSEESEPEYLVKKRKISVVDDKYFDIEPFLGSFFNHYNYYIFRKENPIQDINRSNSPVFFFEYCELIGLKLFHEAKEFFLKNAENENFEDLLLKHLFSHSLK